MTRELNIKAYYRHNNGDMEPVTIIGYDGKGRCWVNWHNDNFVNLVNESRLEIIKIRSVKDEHIL